MLGKGCRPDPNNTFKKKNNSKSMYSQYNKCLMIRPLLNLTGLTASSTDHFCNEDVFSRSRKRKCMQWMHLHMSYSCLTDFVHHRKLQRSVGPYVSYLTQSVQDITTSALLKVSLKIRTGSISNTKCTRTKHLWLACREVLSIISLRAVQYNAADADQLTCMMEGDFLFL